MVEKPNGERELMQAVRDGRQEALRELYDRFGGVLLALCLRILRDRSDAEELLGDVFWELWHRPERYDPARGSLLTYLVTLARSRAIDRLRSHRSRVRREQATEQPPDAPSPFDEAWIGERRQQVRDALGELTEEQRAAIELAFYEGLSHSEISSELEEPLGTVKSRIRSGLIRLRDSLRTLHERGSS